MPVRKFRTFEEASDALAIDRDDPLLPRRLAWVLGVGTRLGARHRQSPGVRKYQSLEEAQADRERLDVEGQEETPPAV